MIQSWDLPIRVYSEMNINDHWTKKRQRRARQQFYIRGWWNKEKPKFNLPLVITLTRLSPRKYDDDNNVSAFKAIRDEIASKIFPEKSRGHADGSKLITWKYSHEKSKSTGIKITFEYNEENSLG
jgi:hypothetical protein